MFVCVCVNVCDSERNTRRCDYMKKLGVVCVCVCDCHGRLVGSIDSDEMAPKEGHHRD